MAMTATELSLDFVSGSKTHFFEDPKGEDSTTSIMPEKLADIYAGADEFVETVLDSMSLYIPCQFLETNCYLQGRK